jgi:DNA-binding MarR family transcriptional regulator
VADQRVDSAELVDLLTWTQRALTRQLGTILDEEGVTVDQWRVLSALETVGGAAMGELATLVEIPHPTLTRLVDGLVDAAWLYRTQSAADRRRVSVHVSDLGRRKLGRLTALAQAHQCALAERIGGDRVRALVEALRVVRAELSTSTMD